MAVPSEAITAEEAEAGIVGEEITDLGPTQRTEVSATLAGDEAEEPPFLVEVGVLHVLTWKCASRHNGVHFFHIRTSKSGANMLCF